jgi:hypothetical protein
LALLSFRANESNPKNSAKRGGFSNQAKRLLKPGEAAVLIK